MACRLALLVCGGIFAEPEKERPEEVYGGHRAELKRDANVLVKLSKSANVFKKSQLSCMLNL
jgi:hypothetical protein